MNIGWFWLLLAIGCGVTGSCLTKAVSTSQSTGLLNRIGTDAYYSCFVVSLLFYKLALEKISLTTAYTLWSGVGTACIAVLSIVLFNERMGFWKVIFIALIIVGAVGLGMIDAISSNSPQIPETEPGAATDGATQKASR